MADEVVVARIGRSRMALEIAEQVIRQCPTPLERVAVVTEVLDLLRDSVTISGNVIVEVKP